MWKIFFAQNNDDDDVGDTFKRATPLKEHCCNLVAPFKM